MGSWSIHPRAAGLEADPYSRAALVRDGALPLAIGEGATFTASRDAAGAALAGSCRYLLTGVTPPARAWTLTAHMSDGGLASHPSGRNGLTSFEILRGRDGTFQIVVAAGAEPGNWLPVAGDRRFVLVLNLYDTPVSALGSAIDPGLVPRIERIGCP
jgi:hypothetical protein